VGGGGKQLLKAGGPDWALCIMDTASSFMPSNTRRIAKNTLALYFRQILIMLVSLYTARAALETLGAEDYGIYSVVAGVVTMFVFLSGSIAAYPVDLSVLVESARCIITPKRYFKEPAGMIGRILFLWKIHGRQ
jgi:hypothetical protein